MSTDVKRAYFYAPGPIYVIIPEEDRQPGDEDMVGQLNLSLYGTRDAASNWSKTYSKLLQDNGFLVGQHSAQNFYHPHNDIAVTCHGDDFTAVGKESELQWLKGVLHGAYECVTEFLGPDKDRHSQQIRILNRVISWHD